MTYRQRVMVVPRLSDLKPSNSQFWIRVLRFIQRHPEQATCFTSRALADAYQTTHGRKEERDLQRAIHRFSRKREEPDFWIAAWDIWRQALDLAQAFATKRVPWSARWITNSKRRRVTVYLPKYVDGPDTVFSRLSGKRLLSLLDEFGDFDVVQRAASRKPRDVAEALKERRQGKKLTLRQLGFYQNAELRRAIMEVVGVIFPDKPMQADDYGRLYRLDRDTHVVQVTCPSTGRVYTLGVPSQCVSAREAVAWTFWIEPSELEKRQLLFAKEA